MTEDNHNITDDISLEMQLEQAGAARVMPSVHVDVAPIRRKLARRQFKQRVRNRSIAAGIFLACLGSFVGYTQIFLRETSDLAITENQTDKNVVLQDEKTAQQLLEEFAQAVRDTEAAFIESERRLAIILQPSPVEIAYEEDLKYAKAIKQQARQEYLLSLVK